MSTFNVAVFAAAVSSLQNERPSRMHIDAEALADGNIGLVLRGHDKVKVGSDSQEVPPMRWSDDKGECRSFMVAHIGTEADDTQARMTQAENMAEALRVFFHDTSKPLAEKMAAVEFNADLMRLALVIGNTCGVTCKKSNKSGWSVTSLKAAQNKANQRIEKANQSMATALEQAAEDPAQLQRLASNPKAMAALAKLMGQAQAVAAK